MAKDRDQFAALMAAATTAAGRAYGEAVAGGITRRPDADAWSTLRRVIARAHVLVSLHAMSSIYRTVAGADGFPSTPDEDIDALSRLATFAAPALTLEGIEPGPFAEAIRAFDGRVPALRRTVEGLWQRADAISSSIVRAEQSEAVARLAQQSIGVQQAIRDSFWATDMDAPTAEKVRDLVGKVVRGFVSADDVGKMIGPSLSQFITAAQASGAGNLTRARVETILNNNLSSAFNEARVTSLADPRTRVIVPLVMLVEVQDRRTRGNPSGLYPDAPPHFQMNGFVGTVDQLNELGIVPPNGHNCRGSIRGISLAKAVRKGWMTEDGDIVQTAIDAHNGRRLVLITSGRYPDPGFRTASVSIAA